jgi:hypothetical protein
MQRYRKEGRYEAVPVFIALDEHFNEAAVMVRASAQPRPSDR